jgi:hypothetical protein
VEKQMKPPKQCTEEEVKYLLSLEDIDLTRELLKELFANKYKKPAKFEPNQTFRLNLLKFKKMLDFNAKEDEYILTTVGRYIFNLYMNDRDNPTFFRINGYVNETLNEKKISEIDANMSKALIENKITSDEYIEYINRRDNLGYFVVNFLGRSLTLKGTIPVPEVEKRKEELFEKHKDAIEKSDIGTVSLIEKELIDIAKEKLKDDPIMDIYESGARGSFSNNYKSSSIMRGAMFSADGEKRVKICKSNLVDGIAIEEMPFFNDLAIYSFVSKGVETQKGGYTSKLLSATFQSLTLDEKGSDCGTKKTVPILIEKDNIEKFMYQYIIENGKKVLLDSETIKKYIGKVVQMRLPLYCISDKLCNICAGDLFYRLEIKNVGLLFNTVGTAILNLSMKKFHDTSVKVGAIDLNKSIVEI